MTPASSRVSNSSLTAAELRSNRKDIRIPGEIVAKVIDSLQRDEERVQHEFTARRERLEKELDLTRRRQDQAYEDKLDGKITDAARSDCTKSKN